MVLQEKSFEQYPDWENDKPVTRLTDHLSDIVPGNTKSMIELLSTPVGEILRKTYLPGQEQFFELEEAFNIAVQRTGFAKKPRLFEVDKENKVVELEYIDGPNLELALLEGQAVDFDDFVDFFLDEQRHLRAIPTNSYFVRNTYSSEVERLLGSRYLDAGRKYLVSEMLHETEYDPVVQRFDAELSNFLWTPSGVVGIDYAAPNVEHPIHGPLYAITHFDRPKKKAFFDIQQEVTDKFYDALMPRLEEFFNGTGDMEATIKCAMLDQFAENFIYGVNGEVKPWDDLNPSYGARMQALRDIVDYSADDILRGKVKFRYDVEN